MGGRSLPHKQPAVSHLMLGESQGASRSGLRSGQIALFKSTLPGSAMNKQVNLHLQPKPNKGCPRIYAGLGHDGARVILPLTAFIAYIKKK